MNADAASRNSTSVRPPKIGERRTLPDDGGGGDQTSPMSNIRDSFADYAAYHQTRGNKWFHRLGIPLIMLTLLGMLERVRIADVRGFRIDAAVVLIAIAVIYSLT